MFSIYDGREKFFQWDKDRKLIVEDKAITQVHFANCLCPNARVCEVSDGLVDVPNELLTEDLDIRVWAYDGEMTKHEQVFEVEKRTKPADYIYTQTDVWTAEKAVEEALEEAKANGDFKGDKGDKGDAGVINFVVVSELPASGSGDSIYLVPNATGENNNFDEYIFQDGAWEKIGSAGVEVNLDEYVKNTDYATQTTAGLVKGSVAFGTYIGTGGIIVIQKATNEEIDAKSQSNKPITPSNLDYAVKKSLTDSKEHWTLEDKYLARELVGAIGTTDYAAAGKPGIVDVNPTEFGIGSYPTSGILYITPASEAQIDAKTHARRPITPSILDYAVKKGLADNKLEWTDEEKAAAREQIGVGIATATTAGLVKPTTWGGTTSDAAGHIYIAQATTACIDAKKGIGERGDSGAITPGNLDYAVKQALTNPLNTTWTEEEKAAARALLGIE